MLDALALGDLVLLLADELGDANGRAGLRAEIAQEPTVVGRVLLFAQAGTKVQEADQLALADERNRQLDSRCLELAQPGRIQVQFVDLDRAGRALKVRD